MINSEGFFTSVFRREEINELFYGKHRLWIEVINKSFEDLVEIKRNQPLGFLAIEPENLKFHCEAPKKEEDTKQTKNIVI